MTQPHFHRLLNLPAFDTIIFDARGVLGEGKTFYPGVAENLQAIIGRGIRCAILTNTTQLNGEVEEEYAERGLMRGTHYELVVTAGDLARRKILARHFDSFSLPAEGSAGFYVMGRPNKKIFADSCMHQVASLAEAQFAYIGVPEIDGIRQSDASGFLPMLQECLQHGLPLLCPNADYFSPTNNGQNACQGLVADAYEKMGGTVEWCGKPYAGVYDMCLEKLGTHDKARILMVGDTLRTDIAGARQAGIRSALVTETGITAQQMVRTGETLEDIYTAESIRPDLTLGRVGSVPTNG